MESFFAVLISVYFIMILAEFGDKTNLIALSLMGKHSNPYLVALFATIGIGLTTILSVLVGGLLGANLPLKFIRYPAAFVFIWLGITSLKEEKQDDDEQEKDLGNSDDISMMRVIYLIALAEFGDKSQLLAITAAAASFPLAVFVGSTLSMGTIMFVTAIVGSMLFERVDPERIEVIAAVLFIVAGLWIGLSTFFW